MHRLGFSALVILATLAAPVMVSANAFTEASLDIGDTHATISLVADEGVSTPRIGTRPGLVKAWFSGMEHNALRIEGDGERFRYVRVRPGANDTSLVIVRLTDRRALARDDIQIQRDGNQVQILIPLSVLPGSFMDAEEAADESAAAATEDAAAADAATAEAASEEVIGRVDSPAEAMQTPLAAGHGANMGVMILVTILLGLIYLLVRIFNNKKRSTGPSLDIEVIANKRLGSKHQLLVVRALGEDHLLSINAGRTDRIASLPTPESAYAEPAVTAESEAPEPGLLRRIQASFGKASQRPTAPAGPDLGEERVSLSTAAKASAFDHELKRAGGSSYPPQSSIPAAAAARGGSSEAVAGLIRLRERSAR